MVINDNKLTNQNSSPDADIFKRHSMWEFMCNITCII